jgi:hypothetical protein
VPAEVELLRHSTARERRDEREEPEREHGQRPLVAAGPRHPQMLVLVSPSPPHQD